MKMRERMDFGLSLRTTEMQFELLIILRSKIITLLTKGDAALIYHSTSQNQCRRDDLKYILETQQRFWF